MKRNPYVVKLMKLAIELATLDGSGPVSEVYNEIVQKSLDVALEHGWDWEKDSVLVEYCLKATSLECSQATYKAYLAATESEQQSEVKRAEWTITYENDTGPDDDGFWEWWTVSNGTTSFECDSKADAEWLRNILTLCVDYELVMESTSLLLETLNSAKLTETQRNQFETTAHDLTNLERKRLTL